MPFLDGFLFLKLKVYGPIHFTVQCEVNCAVHCAVHCEVHCALHCSVYCEVNCAVHCEVHYEVQCALYTVHNKCSTILIHWNKHAISLEIETYWRPAMY